MRRLGLPALLAAAAAVLAIAAAATAATRASARVVAVGAPPLALTPGTRVTVTATILGTARGTVLVGGLLAASTRPRGATMLGKGVSVKVRKGTRRRVVLTLIVPTSLAPGRVGRLLVCVDPTRAVRGIAPATACRVMVGQVAVATAADAGAVIDAAVTAGRLTRGQGLAYRVLAAFGDRSALPSALRGLPSPGGDQQAALTAVAANPGGLPAALRDHVLAYFAPPTGSANAWFGGARRTPAGPARRHQAGVLASDCAGFSTLVQPPDDTIYRRTWQSIETTDGHALVWFFGYSPLEPQYAASAARHTDEDRAKAQAYASALPAIWQKLTGFFGEPLSDAAEPCYHGPDGRLDVYVNNFVGGSFSSIAGAAATLPYPATGAFPTTGQFCTDRPSFIVIAPGRDPFVLAHEFMHVIEFSHRRLTCAEPVAFFDEGAADWAADAVYPSSQYELHEHGPLVRDPQSQDVASGSYEYWALWMMLHRTIGLSALTAVFDQLRTKPAIEAVDAAVPGGWSRQLPQLALTIWNQDPTGAAGWPITEDYRTWEGDAGTPTRSPARTLALAGGAASVGYPLVHTSCIGGRGTCTESFPALSIGAYDDVVVTDPKVRRLRFTNVLADKPAHVDAMVKLTDGTWRLEDWTGRKEITFCRDTSDEDVARVIVVSTNTSLHAGLAPFTHLVEAQASCPYPHRFVGTFHTVYTFDLGGIFETLTYDGTATLVRSPNNPPDDLGRIAYALQSGSLTWSAQHSDPNCATSDSGSATLSTTQSTMTLEDTRTRTPSPGPTPTPWEYAFVLTPDLPGQWAMACPGGTIHPYLIAEGLTNTIVPAASPTSLQGGDTTGQPGMTVQQTWSFTGFPE